jgi:hypothetical protein
MYTHIRILRTEGFIFYIPWRCEAACILSLKGNKLFEEWQSKLFIFGQCWFWPAKAYVKVTFSRETRGDPTDISQILPQTVSPKPIMKVELWTALWRSVFSKVYVCLSICLSDRPSVRPCTRPSDRPSDCPSARLSDSTVRPSVWRPDCLSVQPPLQEGGCLWGRSPQDNNTLEIK